MTLATRIHPLSADEAALRRQWMVGPEPGRTRTVLLRVPPEDGRASDHLVRLAGLSPTRLDRIEAAWSAAQLAADATVLGMGLGVRVVLVPEGGRWYADLLVIRTRGRVRIGRGSIHVTRSLAGARRTCLRSLGSDVGGTVGSPTTAAAWGGE